MRYACVYVVLSATDQAKAVGELTRHVRETTSELGKQEIGETTCGRNDCKPYGAYRRGLYMVDLSSDW